MCRLRLALAASLLAVGIQCGAAEGERAEHELTQTQAAAMVQQRYAARVVRASSVEQGGHHVFVFRLLSQAGKVWEVQIDARSGAEVR